MAKSMGALRSNITATTISSACLPRLDYPRAKPRMQHLGGSRAPRAMFIVATGLLSLLAACGRANTQSQRSAQGKIWEDFSGDRALAHVQTMVDFGPRPPGTEMIEKTRKFLTAQLEASGWKVERQVFSNETPRGKVEFVNLIATFPAQERKQSLLLCCSYH